MVGLVREYPPKKTASFAQMFAHFGNFHTPFSRDRLWQPLQLSSDYFWDADCELAELTEN